MGTSSPPLPLETYKMQVKAEASGTKDIILPLRNMQVERARTWLQNRGAGPPNPPPDYITYDVKVSSPYYTAPKQVSIYNGNGTT
ncbi:ANK1, partial [Symbiodinium pilosum]